MKGFQLYLRKYRQNFSTIKPPKLRNESPNNPVKSIIQNQNRNQNFVYRQTRRVCNTIVSLFEGLPQKQQYNLYELKRLLKNIHLSSFSSWKALKQTSDCINQILNKQLAYRKNRLTKNSLISLCDVLYSLNYEMQVKQDKQFIDSQIRSLINIEGYNYNFDQNLRILQGLSKHPCVFRSILQQKKRLQQYIIKKITNKQQLKQQNNDLILISNIIKNGIYSKQWSINFIQQVKNILELKNKLLKQQQSILNVIKLNNSLTNYKQDIWTTKIISKHNQSIQHITQSKIHNILKQLNYNIQSNQCIFNFQVDFLINPQFIIEYHGIHHYKINTKSPIQNNKSYWKTQALKAKGYQLFIIPFYDWNKLQTIYQKKSYLIHNLENSLLLS